MMKNRIIAQQEFRVLKSGSWYRKTCLCASSFERATDNNSTAVPEADHLKIKADASF
jgi:hypothetical protein